MGDVRPARREDFRIGAYRVLKTLLVVGLCALGVKLFILDSAPVATDQMAPALKNGDRVIVFRLFTWPPFNRFVLPARRCPALLKHPEYAGKLFVARIAALPGDTVSVRDGVATVAHGKKIMFGTPLDTFDVLPATYAPRDTFADYVVPRPGDTLDFETLLLRDWMFAAGIVARENPKQRYAVHARIFFDGVEQEGLVIADFARYRGSVDSVPDSLSNSWFFWDRLLAYLQKTYAGTDVQLQMSLVEDGVRLSRYVVRESFIFCLADNWREGFDSRYFGMLPAGSVLGRIVGVAWSVGPGGMKELRLNRILRIVR